MTLRTPMKTKVLTPVFSGGGEWEAQNGLFHVTTPIDRYATITSAWIAPGRRYRVLAAVIPPVFQTIEVDLVQCIRDQLVTGLCARACDDGEAV